MGQQGLRQASYRAIHGATGGSLNEDMLKAFAAEATIPAGATINGAFILWLQERLSSSNNSLPGLQAAFAAAEGATNWPSVGSFDANIQAETLTLLAAMTDEPDETRIGVINDLIADLKSAGVWAKLDALWVFATTLSADALLNWKDPGTFDATLVNAPTFTAETGFTTNGTDNYIETNFNPSTAGGNYTQDSASLGYWELLDAAHANFAIGWYDGTDGAVIIPRSATNTLSIRINQGTANTAAMASSIGLSAANRSTSTAIQSYKNAVIGVNGSRASTPLNNASFSVGRGTAASLRPVQATAAFAGGSLDATQHAALYAALAAYMTAVLPA